MKTYSQLNSLCNEVMMFKLLNNSLDIYNSFWLEDFREMQNCAHAAASTFTSLWVLCNFYLFPKLKIHPISNIWKCFVH